MVNPQLKAFNLQTEIVPSLKSFNLQNDQAPVLKAFTFWSGPLSEMGVTFFASELTISSNANLK
ncbi:MAG: hypothetical protein WC746_05385 [archaeon]